jgi:hexosaminidase
MNLLPMPRHVNLGDRLTPRSITVERVDGSLPAQGYELTIREDGVTLVGGDDAGCFYGRATIEQLARVNDGRLPIGTVRDHPDLAIRGVMLDISRDKVPTTATLHAIIDRLASWKINQLQLYSEHTFAYKNHRDVHADASPVTADEIRALDIYCRERHVELVPNQNCLGHMNRWLKHERYRDLALAPDGFVDPYGLGHEAMTIDPAQPGSLALVRELLGELLTQFSSRRVNVGLDETWELPPDRLDEYFEWIATLRALPELDGREVIVWGDMFSGQPDLVAKVPDGITVCEWGYDGEYPFDERTALLALSGRPFWVAPGTSGWLSIGGRLTNCIENCSNAAQAALDHGGLGFLNTDWGDRGHLQQWPVSDPGFAYGAAVSWCLDSNRDLDLADALSIHAYNDPTGGLASALLTIGDAYREITPQIPNHSILAMHLYFPQVRVGRGVSRGMTNEELDAVAARLARARVDVQRAQPQRNDRALLIEEVMWTIEMLDLLVDDARARLAHENSLASVPQMHRHALAQKLESLTDRYRTLWLARNRPGGLTDSVTWLDHLYNAYETGNVDASWGGWPKEFT